MDRVLSEDNMPEVFEHPSTREVVERGFQEPRTVMLIVGQRAGQDLRLGDSELGTARSGKYLGNARVVPTKQLNPCSCHCSFVRFVLLRLVCSKWANLGRATGIMYTSKIRIAMLLNVLKPQGVQ